MRVFTQNSSSNTQKEDYITYTIDKETHIIIHDAYKHYQDFKHAEFHFVDWEIANLAGQTWPNMMVGRRKPKRQPTLHIIHKRMRETQNHAVFRAVLVHQSKHLYITASNTNVEHKTITIQCIAMEQVAQREPKTKLFSEQHWYTNPNIYISYHQAQTQNGETITFGKRKLL